MRLRKALIFHLILNLDVRERERETELHRETCAERRTKMKKNNLSFHIEDKNLLFVWLAFLFTGRATCIFSVTRSHHMPARMTNVMQFAAWVAGLLETNAGTEVDDISHYVVHTIHIIHTPHV